MADDNLRQDLVDQVREEQQKQRRAPRVHRVPRGETPVDSAASAATPGTAPSPRLDAPLLDGEAGGEALRANAVAAVAPVVVRVERRVGAIPNPERVAATANTAGHAHTGNCLPWPGCQSG